MGNTLTAAEVGEMLAEMRAKIADMKEREVKADTVKEREALIEEQARLRAIVYDLQVELARLRF